MINGDPAPVEHQGGQIELEEMKENRTGAAKKTDQNQKNRGNKKKKVKEGRKEESDPTN